MTQPEYEAERDQLIENGGIPSEAFLESFLERLPDEDIIPEEYLGRDTQDYVTWGYALFGDWEDAEDLMRELKLFHWVEIYAAIEDNDIDAFQEAIYELFEIADKMDGAIAKALDDIPDWVINTCNWKGNNQKLIPVRNSEIIWVSEGPNDNGVYEFQLVSHKAVQVDREYYTDKLNIKDHD